MRILPPARMGPLAPSKRPVSPERQAKRVAARAMRRRPKGG